MIVKTDIDEFRDFLSDAANFKGSAEKVYFPETEADLVSILKECSAQKTKVTIAGNGTGVTGARVPQGGVVISTSKLNKIIEINETEKYAIVQTGVILNDIQDLAESKKLFYPPDPTERNCFIGATIATNASGARTFKYGPTRNYVLSLRIVLADGETLTLERGKIFAEKYVLNLITDSGKNIAINIPEYKMPPTKNSAGYYVKENVDAIDLFIGSEGTLGVITEARLKLLDLPENLISCVLFFREEEDALAFISEARKESYKSRDEKNTGKIDARGLEFFDVHSLGFLSDGYPSIPRLAKAAVWFEQEFTAENEKLLFDLWLELISSNRGDFDTAWFALNKTDYEKFKDFRHSISWQVNEYCASRGVMKVGTDTAVPQERFAEFYSQCKELTKEARLNYVAYGHAGDSHIHLNMLPENMERYAAAREVYRQICRKAVEYGGTISAEHGIGKLKRDYLIDMCGLTFVKQMARMKKQFDPDKILGIGNIFDEKLLDE